MLQSSISWIDFSDQDRRKMMEVVAAFRQRDTRDELGLGSIRDAFAELFFPGTSTLQTRARYLLFIPWLYRYYEERRVPSSKIAGRLQGDEIKLINALKSVGEEGVIGQVSGASLQRFPSSIYWNGLRRWGILRFAGSQGQYQRYLDRFYRQQSERFYDVEPAEGWDGGNWDPGLPCRPDGFPDQVDFCLTYQEATYLHQRLLISCPDSLLATVADRCQPVTQDVGFIWQHPQRAEFSEEQRPWIKHAHCFSMVMYGAALLYNLMLAEHSQADELLGLYREELELWREEMIASWATLLSWDRRDFWRLARSVGRIPLRTQGFVNKWLDALLAGSAPIDVIDHAGARALIREREVWLKRGRSRFESRRHLEMWSGAAGAFRMDYRWSIARRITNDIIRGRAEESCAES